MPRSNRFELLLAGCFFLSGLTALVYEVVWSRQLGWFLGSTAHAHAAVITAYMTGLAAGSVYFGRRADRGIDPFRTYAWLEIGVGVYAASTPWLFSFLQHAYVGMVRPESLGDPSGYAARFTIALLALLVPTFLMGGTLPLLVKGMSERLPTVGENTGRLYGINTLGAMAGTLLAGFLLLPGLGVKASLFVSVAINLGIAAVVLAVLRGLPNTGASRQHLPERSLPPAGLIGAERVILLAGFGLAGFAALLTQMAWIRAMILVVGGSVYAFSITLAGFLAGIGIGSLILGHLSRRASASDHGWKLRHRLSLASALAVFIGATLLVGLPLIGKMPEWLLAAFGAGLHRSFPALQGFIFLLALALMVLPTTGMGILFPLVSSTAVRSADETGRSVGVAYGVNTIGAILGALAGGLLILPWLGIHRSIQLAAALYLVAAFLFWLLPWKAKPIGPRLLPAVATAALLGTFTALIPSWNRELMVSGIFQAPSVALEATRNSSLPDLARQFELLYYQEGRDGTVAVRRNGLKRSLLINGKADASSHDDLPTQILLAQLPLALDREIRSALVVGLGSGITAGSLAASRRLEQLRIIEISQEVVEASEYFRPENHNVLDDPRSEIVTADARNFLIASPDRYDLIVSEPSNPWLKGVSGLFTREFIAIAKSRLSSRGVMAQWFHTYGMANPDLRAILKTFAEQFRYVSVFSPMIEDIVLVGSDEPLALRPVLDPALAAELGRAGLTNDRDLVRLFLLGGDDLDRYVQEAGINSDDHPVLEFSAPRHLYTRSVQQNLADIAAFLDGQPQSVPVADAVGRTNEALNAYFMNLKVEMNGRFHPSAVEPAWTVTQRLAESTGGEARRVVESARLLAWNEGADRFHVRAEWLPGAMGQTAFERSVAELSATSGQEVRRFDTPGGPAAGVVSPAADGVTIRVAVVRQCPARPAGVTQLVLQAEIEDTGREAWPDLLARQVNRLSCT